MPGRTRDTSWCAMSDAPDHFEHQWRRRFERYAATHDDDAGIAGWSTGGLAARYRRFVHAWEADEQPAARGHWLDAGCGAGTYSRYLVEQGQRITAVDYSLPTTQKARARLRADALWAVADVTQLPFASGSFDGALCFGVMQALATNERALGELRRVLRPGGTLWVDALNARCVPSFVNETWRRLRGWPRHLRYDAPGEFRRALHASGFIDIRIDWVPILPARLRRFQPLVERPFVRGLLRRVPPFASAISHSILVRARVQPPVKAAAP